MTLQNNNKSSARYSFYVWAVIGLFVFVENSAQAGVNGPLPEFNTTRPYLIYYGNWTSGLVDYARTNYELVILHPASNITSNQIARIKSGKDGIPGTADDVKVLAYLSIGEDDRNGAPFAGDGMGPRVDPRASDTVPLSSITNALGLPSAGGTNYASYYLNSSANQTGVPDVDSAWGSFYVNAGAPAWWNVLQTMTKAVAGQSGLQEILTTNYGNSLNCDGVFLDTIDTAAPDTWGTPYEWTAPGMQGLIGQIHTNYPGKLLMGNRGLFYYDPNLKTYPYSPRPYLDMVMFESYYSDSSTNLVSLSFPDNKWDLAPKLNAEAGRPDGFNVFVVDYDHTPPQPANIVNQDYVESIGIQGWPLYRTNPDLDEVFQTNAMIWLSTNADNLPPAWDSTTANGPTPPAPRIGIQEAVATNNSVTIYWDVAHDQTGPVHYNAYYSTGGTLNFATATKISQMTPGQPANYNYPSGTGPGYYPYCHTVNGLQNGMTYVFAVRAEDSCTPAHEDSNTVSITVVAGANKGLSTYKTITIDGSFSDWTGVPWAYQGAPDGNPVNYLQVQLANDAQYLYGHVILASPYALFSDYYSHIFFDTALNAQAGYPVSGALFGSEMMIESGYGYDERNGAFNAGGVSDLGWAIQPSASSTNFEFRISLGALYSDNTPVFTNNTFRVLLQDDRGPECAVATGIEYSLAPAELGPLFISATNGMANVSWTGPGTLQYTSVFPGGPWTSVTNATSPYMFPAGSGQQFFRLSQ